MNKKNREKNNKSTYVFTRETLGMTLLLFSAILLLMLFTGKAVFAGIGKAICLFMFGTFGYGSFLLVAILAYFGEWLVFGKSLKISFKTAFAVCLTVFAAFLLFHAATSRNISLDSYGGYISDCYTNAENGIKGYTFGGVISALIVYPVAKVTTFVGAYIIFSLLTIAAGYFLFTVLFRRKGSPASKVTISNVTEDVIDETVETPVVRSAPQQTLFVERRNEVAVTQPPVQRIREEDANPYSQKNLGRKILFEKGEFDAESYRRNMIFSEDSYFNHPVHNKTDYLNSFASEKKGSAVPIQSYAESYQEDVLNQPAVSAPSNYVYGDKPVDKLDDYEEVSGGVYSSQSCYEAEEEQSASGYSETIREEVNSFADDDTYTQSDNYILNEPVNSMSEDLTEETDEPTHVVSDRSERVEFEQVEEEEKPIQDGKVDMFSIFGSSNASLSEKRIEPDVSRLASRRAERSKANIFDDESDGIEEQPFSLTRNSVSESRTESRTENKAENISESITESVPEKRIESRGLIGERRVKPEVQKTVPKPVEEAPKQEEKPKHVWKKYIRPGLDLLDDYPESGNVNTGEIEDNKRTIVETLARFKIESEVSNVTIGPAITRYDIIVEDKTKIKQALNYREAIAMALMKENVTAYLNYSKGAVSIEVPNNSRTVVGLKSMLSSSKFINCKPKSITFALGKNIEGEVVCPDITKMPHLLVAGTTGSGKSICLSSLLISLLYKYGPEDLRLILVDPKQVEFISYDKLPHLMINEIIYDVDKAIKALNWAIKEMERRYTLFKDMTEKGTATKTLDEYNNHLPDGEEKLPKVVIILDEFGDLMLQAKKDIESRIIKLVQKARAAGIHLILATQRPSVDCITGLIKSNLPTRIGFKVNSFDDARTIFDIGGAEKLLGKGDLYFRSAESPDLARIQGCFVDTHEVQKVTDFVKAHNETYFDQSVSDFINKVEAEENSNSMGGDDGNADAGDTKIDDTYIKALFYCVTSNQASVSMIQRRFPVGYIKACKIIDWMENMNYVTQSEGSKPRKVLLSKEEFINTYGEIDD